MSLDRPVTGGLDSAQTVDSDSKIVSFHIEETLVRFDETTNTPQPALAESWEESPDHLEFTFHLRHGVKFQDGTDFNADAVVASLMRIYDENHPLHNNGAFISAGSLPLKSAEKIDDFTVKLIATSPDPIFLWRVGTEPGYIQSPTAMEKYGKDYTNHAVGTGPFMITAFDPTTTIELARFDDYWGTKPSFSKLIFKVNTDDSGKVADLLAGNVDVVARPPAAQLEQLRGTAGIAVDILPLRWMSDITLNTSVVPFNDPIVRQAVNYGFDRETLSNTLNYGIPKPLYSIWFEDGFAYEPNIPHYGFDPDKARQLLDSAGWTLPAGKTVREKGGKPLHIRLVQAGTLLGFEAPVPELFQANMRDIGMEVESVKQDAATMFDPKVGIFNPATQEATVLGWIAQLPDPSFQFRIIETKSIPPAYYNVSFYSNPEVDKLLEAGSQEFDQDKRAEDYKEVQRIVMAAPPIIPHSRFTLPVAHSDKVTGFVVHGDSTIDFRAVTIAP